MACAYSVAQRVLTVYISDRRYFWEDTHPLCWTRRSAVVLIASGKA